MQTRLPNVGARAGRRQTAPPGRQSVSRAPDRPERWRWWAPLLLVLAAFMPVSASDEAAAGRPQLRVEPPTFDLGQIVRGASAKGTFELRNQGDAPLVIHSATPG